MALDGATARVVDPDPSIHAEFSALARGELDELLTARSILDEVTPPGVALEVGIMVEGPRRRSRDRSFRPARGLLQHRHHRPDAVHPRGRTRKRCPRILPMLSIQASSD